MTDLWIAGTILTAASLGLFAFSATLTRRKYGRVELWGAVGLMVLALYWLFMRDSERMLELLPVSSVIILGNWFLPIAGFLAGVAFGGIPGTTRRKVLYTLAMWSVGVYAVVRPLWGSTPHCHDLWWNGICLQTSARSCSAACAATVLAEVGIPASEAEMAELCLTRDGTLWLGLYRGLKLKTAGTAWDVRPVNVDADELPSRPAHPLVLSVGLPDDTDVDPIYMEQFGWVPGELHSVVFFGMTRNGFVRIGDPGVESGRELWRIEHFRVLYRGRALQLVPRVE